MLAKAYGLDELALLSFSTGPVSRFNSGQTEHRVKGVQAEQAVGSGAIRGAHAIWTQLSCLNPAPSTRAALPPSQKNLRSGQRGEAGFILKAFVYPQMAFLHSLPF